MAMNMIEKAFYEEIREKKKAGIGIFSQKGKGKKHGTQVSLPYDFLSSKEKRSLNGKVRIFSVYQSLMPLQDFQRNPEHMQKMVLEKWREVHSNFDIYNALGISRVRYYDMLDDLGVEKKERGRNMKPKQHEVIPHEGIISLDEFQKLEDSEQKELLINLRENFKTEDIKHAWGMSTGGFYTIINKLGIETSGPNSGRKKIEINMAAQLGSLDILDYRTFRSLNKEQQAELLDEYKRRFPNQSDLAEAWGIAKGTLYGLTGKLKNIEYNPTPKEEILKVKVQSKEKIEQAKFFGIEKKKAEPKQEILPLEETEVIAPAPVEEIQEFHSSTPTLEEQMKDLIQQMNRQAETIDKQAQQIARLYQNESVAKEHTYIEESKPTPTEGFTMNYEKVSEGFMAHADIKRFISVLEKNPDKFKVNISITRIED